jgi:hypothetical protein
MDEVRARIEKELEGVMDRLRQLGGAVVIEDFPGAGGDQSPSADLPARLSGSQRNGCSTSRN